MTKLRVASHNFGNSPTDIVYTFSGYDSSDSRCRHASNASEEAGVALFNGAVN